MLAMYHLQAGTLINPSKIHFIFLGLTSIDQVGRYQDKNLDVCKVQNKNLSCTSRLNHAKLLISSHIEPKNLNHWFQSYTEQAPGRAYPAFDLEKI